jgi:hypothetical protein
MTCEAVEEQEVVLSIGDTTFGVAELRYEYPRNRNIVKFQVMY